MHLSFLLPDLHEHPTGGNIYNRRVITELHSRHTVNAPVWAPESDPPPSLPSDAPLVVDSLFVHHDEPLRALCRSHPGPCILLAHYLHCIDPQAQDAAAAETERALFPLFDGVITTSRYARQALTTEGIPADRIGVVPPGLDAPYRAPLADEAAGGPPRLLTVANVLPGKGLLSLLDQLEALDDLSWQWHLVGDDSLDPDYAATVHSRRRASPLADRMTGPGPVPPDEMRAQYDRADIFVLPSRFETCSMATREALARGLPVVAHAVGGLPENLGVATPAGATAPETPPAGRLVPPTQSLAAPLRTLLTEPETRADMSAAARARSAAFPTWEAAAHRFCAFLQSL